MIESNLATSYKSKINVQFKIHLYRVSQNFGFGNSEMHYVSIFLYVLQNEYAKSNNTERSYFEKKASNEQTTVLIIADPR